MVRKYCCQRDRAWTFYWPPNYPFFVHLVIEWPLYPLPGLHTVIVAKLSDESVFYTIAQYSALVFSEFSCELNTSCHFNCWTWIFLGQLMCSWHVFTNSEPKKISKSRLKQDGIFLLRSKDVFIYNYFTTNTVVS